MSRSRCMWISQHLTVLYPSCVCSRGCPHSCNLYPFWSGTRRRAGASGALNWKSGPIVPQRVSGVCWSYPSPRFPLGASFLCRQGDRQGRDGNEESQTPFLLKVVTPLLAAEMTGTFSAGMFFIHLMIMSQLIYSFISDGFLGHFYIGTMNKVAVTFLSCILAKLHTHFFSYRPGSGIAGLLGRCRFNFGKYFQRVFKSGSTKPVTYWLSRC